MASSLCTKCLARPSTTQLTSLLSASRAFSTTPNSQAKATGDGLKKQQAKAAHLKNKRTTNTLKIKKKIPVKTGKPPMPGERKAMRKRIVLSNTNALEVQGMQNLTAEMVDEEGFVGKVVGLSDKTVDSLRAAEAFKVTQSWGMFRRPGLLIRDESVQLGKKLVDVEGNKSTLKLVLDGDRVSGKSLMLIHAMAAAFVRGWIVLNIPEAQDLTNASTAYAPIPNTTPKLYSQNDYVAAWLERISKSNSAILNSLELSLQHDLPIPIQENITLFRLCELGARDPDVAWPIFQALWAELTAEGRPPILMTLDSLQYAMQNTLYNASDLRPIHAHDLAILKHFTDYLSGTKSLPNGGAIVAATQRSHAPINITMNLAITQAEDKQLARTITAKDPFERKYDPRVEQALSAIELLRLNGLSRFEARGLMEYWAQSGVLRSVVDEKSVAEKWALAGNGIVGEIERGALKMRI